MAVYRRVLRSTNVATQPLLFPRPETTVSSSQWPNVSRDHTFLFIVEGNQYYDENGNLIRRVDRNGQTTRYDYDARNRLLQRVSKDETVGYTYDAMGKRTSMTDSTGITSYQYDPYTEQLITVTFPDGLHLKNQYDANGNRIKMKEPFGSEVSYTYDTRNRLTSAGTDPSSPDAKYTYYKNGLLEQMIGFNGLKHQFQYAGMDLARLNVNQGEQTVDDFKYTRDDSKNIVKREQKSLVEQEETTDLFQYDVLNRVVGSSEYKASYEYDTRGNRQTLTTERPLKTVPSEYNYDAENRLTQVRKNGKNVQYMYNGDGLLVGRIEGGVQTRYYYDGDQMIAEATVENGTPKLKARYIRGQKLEAIQYADGTKAYPIYNGHGDIVELRDSKGNVLNTYNYDIWGNITSSQEKVYNPFRYSGELWDDTTELQYLRARWYDPDSGRFINEDTYEGILNNPSSLNLYTYVTNNPLKYVDPTGNWCQSVDGKSSHSGGCSDISRSDRYVPDSLFKANQHKSYSSILQIYEKQKRKAIDKAKNISVFRLVKDEVALPVNNAGSSVNSLLQVLGMSAAMGIEASKTKVDTNTTLKPRTIYRNGTGTNVNLTPRTVDTSGLSYFLNVMGNKGTLTTVEAVNATGVLKAVIDNPATGHVSVSAIDPYEHKMWIASREKANESPYYLTEILQSISIKY